MDSEAANFDESCQFSLPGLAAIDCAPADAVIGLYSARLLTLKMDARDGTDADLLVGELDKAPSGAVALGVIEMQRLSAEPDIVPEDRYDTYLGTLVRHHGLPYSAAKGLLGSPSFVDAPMAADASCAGAAAQ